MAGIEFVSFSKFNENPELQQEYGSYTKYLTAYTKSLNQTSLMTFAKNNKNLMYSLPNSVRDNIWARSKQADVNKTNAEDAYYAALEAEANADTAKSAAEREYKKMASSFDEKDSRVTNAQNKYITAMKTASGAEFSRELLGEKMVNASKLAQSAFAQGLIVDGMLNIKS